MKSRIRSFLGIDTRGKYVREYLDVSNMRSGIFMSVIILALETWMIVSLIVTLAKGDHNRSIEWIIGHAASYAVLFTVALIFLIYSIRNLRRGKNNHIATMALCWIFAVAAFAFSYYISYYDYLKKEQIFTFISMVTFVLCLLVWRPIFALIISTVSFILMYVVMYLTDGASYATQVNLFVLWICVSMVALANHYQRTRAALKDQELEEAYQDLKNMVLVDTLTGMRNRNGLKEEIPDFLEKELIVLMVDVDNFKYLNDTYGHETGDRVLVGMTELLQECFSVAKDEEPAAEHIHVFRFGGDELIVLAESWDLQRFEEKMKEWQQKVYKIGFEDSGLRVLTSCGYSYGYAKKEEDIHDLIRYADRAVYEAKHLGRLQILGESAEEMAKKERGKGSASRMMTEGERDALTGLPNIQYFREHADKLLTEGNAIVEDMVFFYFDIQNFKDYNEKYGFRSGDELLRCIADKIDEEFAGNLVARISDDHFMVLAYEDGGREKIGRIRSELHSMRKQAALEFKVGLYMPERGDRDASLCCDRARLACNSIKHSFQENYRLYDNELEETLKKRQHIINSLEEAVEQNWIKVYYQPIVWLKTGKICGMEALARWIDPVYGMISPGEFVEVLEDCRLIHKLDQHIIRTVCREFKADSDKGNVMVPVSLNFSRLDFELCDMVEYLEKTAAEYGISKEYLEVEITESALTDRPEFLENAMQRFRTDGFKLWLDDFGSGYSSLNVLKDFQFDVLKIDMKFLSDFGSNDKAKPILNNVVRLANDISILPLTEGVETNEQADFLNKIGCKRAQGYYYSRPMDGASLRDMINRGEMEISEELVKTA